MMNRQYNISVIMPAYNEEDNLKKAVLHTMETFREIGLNFEIIIVDDKSTDRTGEIGDRLANKYSAIRCVHHEKNLGVGGAFKTGIAHATKEYIIFIPADNPLDVADIEVYLPRMGVCDIIVGVRTERIGYTKIARFASFVYNRILVPLLFNIGLSDVNWIQIYRRSLFTDNIIQFSNPGIFFLVEILVQAKRNRLIIAEVPAKMRKRTYGKPTCSRLSVMWRTFCDMIRFFWMIHKNG